MNRLCLLAAVVSAAALAQPASAAKITGEYLEARTCNVYTGPCFANAEMSLSGKEAIMAWKVDKGAWNDVDLKGLGAALVVKAQGTLGYDGVFPMQAGKVKSVILVDEDATEQQHKALVDFVRDSAKELTKDVLAVEKVPFDLTNDHIDHAGKLKAGKQVELTTRKLKDSDCVCTNEVVYYQPLTKIENASAAYSLKLSYQGKDLGSRFTNNGIRSAFIGTFRR
jgi:hypothetical protein